MVFEIKVETNEIKGREEEMNRVPLNVRSSENCTNLRKETRREGDERVTLPNNTPQFSLVPEEKSPRDS